MNAKGIIALDLDGTTAIFRHGCFYIPSQVARYLSQLQASGWIIAFITGRTAHISRQILTYCQFPHYICAQNGSVVLEAHTNNVLKTCYLSTQLLPTIDSIFKEVRNDYLVYSGVSQQDQCFFRPDRLGDFALKFIQEQKKIDHDQWQPLSCFSQLTFTEFPTIKCYGPREEILEITSKLNAQLDLHIPIINMPVNPGLYIAQASNKAASKGNALLFLKQHHKLDKGITIAAGDDHNDESMLKIADIKIVMASATDSLKEMATIIAPPCSEMGIIQGLEKAMEMASI